MGIYLPDMEMPRKGQMLVIFPDGTSYVCFNGMQERLAQTKAVPVPSHDDLIDRAALRAEVKKHATPSDAWVFSLIRTAPTIIEAEED